MRGHAVSFTENDEFFALQIQMVFFRQETPPNRYLVMDAAPARATSRHLTESFVPKTSLRGQKGHTFLIHLGSSPLAHGAHRSEEHTSELQSQSNLVCRL